MQNSGNNCLRVNQVSETSLQNPFTGLSRLKLFWALSRTPHGLLDMCTPAFGALLWLGHFPSLTVIVIGLVTTFAGYTAVYALNDVIDYRVDKEKVAEVGLSDAGSDLDSVGVRHPMAQGLLTGKFGPDHTFEKGDIRDRNKLFQPDTYARAQEALSKLRPLAEQRGVTLGQLALSWVTSHPDTCAIAGARNPDQASENARAGAISLSDDELSQIDEIGRGVTDYLDEDPVMWNL